MKVQPFSTILSYSQPSGIEVLLYQNHEGWPRLFGFNDMAWHCTAKNLFYILERSNTLLMVISSNVEDPADSCKDPELGPLCQIRIFRYLGFTNFLEHYTYSFLDVYTV
jgi:hypothetical protein